MSDSYRAGRADASFIEVRRGSSFLVAWPIRDTPPEMSREAPFWRWRAWALSAAIPAAIAALGAGCGTDARGIDSCRKIEEARCRQLPSCPSYGVHTTDDVEACVAFYRDQCLHGLSGDDPGGPATDGCVHSVEQAGACAATSGETASIKSCNPAPSASTTATTACLLIAFPETAAECAFLTPVPPLADAGVDSGTQTGASDASDGAPE